MPVLNSILNHHDVSAIVATFAGAVTRDDPSVVEPRIGVMFIILFISLFAVSFPGVSKQIAFLRIPHILFFIGKHFGTGVILATAFIHLLSDAFESLQRPAVKEQYHNIGKWTGLIILSSLLIIFLVEYISTSYVDHLQADPSAPPSPIGTPAPSRPRSRTRSSRPGSSKRLLAIEPVNEHTPLLTASPSPLSHTPTPPAQAIPVIPSHVPPKPHISHTKTPLAAKPFPPKRAQSLSYLPPSTRPHPLSNSRNIHNLSFYSNSHNTHAHIFHPGHLHHHPAPSSLIPIDILTNTPRLIRGTTGGGVCVCVVGEDSAVSSRGVSASKSVNKGSRGRSGRPVQPGEEEDDDVGSSEGSQIVVEREEQIPRVGRRRQVVGILVLQLGIMIHSLVIGLTLAITNGADFTSLTTAIIFHQLFEGLSLGIRIAALPPAKEPLSLSSPPLSTSQHSHSPSTSSHSHSRSSPTLIPSHHSPSPSHEQRHHVGWWRWPRLSSWHPNWLKWTLSILFAITTPFGMGVGMMVFASKGRSQHDVARMYLTQGLMSAISAGMLIYAATVEMIAGDFVFGDVAGHSHSHGHSHGGGFDTEGAFVDVEDAQSVLSEDADEQHPQGHAHAHMHEPGHSQMHHPERMCKRRQSGGGSTDDVEEAAEELEGRDGRLRKKVLAVGSLLAGVGGMVLIGLAE